MSVTLVEFIGHELVTSWKWQLEESTEALLRL